MQLFISPISRMYAGVPLAAMSRVSPTRKLSPLPRAISPGLKRSGRFWPFDVLRWYISRVSALREFSIVYW